MKQEGSGKNQQPLPIAGTGDRPHASEVTIGRPRCDQQADGRCCMRQSVKRLRLLAAAARYLTDRSGVTAIEYALIAGIVVIAVAALVNGIGTSVSGMISSVSTGL
jgi:pilus assembly protein Flp/PilA